MFATTSLSQKTVQEVETHFSKDKVLGAAINKEGHAKSSLTWKDPSLLFSFSFFKLQEQNNAS